MYRTLSQLHPAAVLMGGGPNAIEGQGALTTDGTLAAFPVAEAGQEDMRLLQRLQAQGPVRVHFQFTNHIAKGVRVPQVVAEIPGSEKADEVVVVGAHLDSWNPGTGAQDNGTGAATVVAAAREIMSSPECECPQA